MSFRIEGGTRLAAADSAPNSALLAASESQRFKDTLTSLSQASLDQEGEHTEERNSGSQRSYRLDIQCTLFAHRMSRWMTLTALETMLENPLAEREKSRLLSASDFSREIDTLLSRHSLPFFRNLTFKFFILPLCKKAVPHLLQKSFERFSSSVLSTCKPEAEFPKDLALQKIRDVTNYFSVLHSALQRTARNPLINKPLVDHIGDELEAAQATSYSTEDLYDAALRKGVDLCVAGAHEAISDQLDKKPFYLRWPGRIASNCSFFCLRLLLPPIYGIARAWIVPGMIRGMTAGHQPGSPTSSDVLRHPLAPPLLRFAHRILDAFFHNLQSCRNLARVPSVGIDREALKVFMKQQILLLGLCSCSTQTSLQRALEPSRLQWFLDQIEDRFVLDDVATTINGVIGILWQTLTEENFLEGELHRLFSSLNANLIDPHPDPTALTTLESKIDRLSEYLIERKITTALNQTERSIDKGLSFWRGWPDRKRSITAYIASWLGKPIKHAIADRAIPFAIDASNQTSEDISKFWTKPYNLRYGLLHYTFLLPWLR